MVRISKREIARSRSLRNPLGSGMWSSSPRWTCTPVWGRDRGTRAFIHPDDIADVATAALTTRNHDGQSLVITGPEALTYGEMAATIGGVIGKRVHFEELSDKQAFAGVVGWAGKGPYADALVDIWRAVREGRLATVCVGLKQVIGREPIPFHRRAEET